MKRYKHIPTGKVGSLICEGHSFLEMPDNVFIPIDLIKSGKDWEEIKDKPEWTILSFKNISDENSNGKISVLRSNGNYNFEEQDSKDESTWCTLDSMLESVGWRYNVIHSVRRESDGEVFTVGDKVYFQFASDWWSINKFEIVNNCVIVNYNGRSCNILSKEFQKYKPKEWEITAFRGKVNHAVFYFLTDIGTYAVNVDGTQYSKVHLLNTSITEIYSVKRLSDGEVFTLGDKCTSSVSKDFGSFKLEKFTPTSSGDSIVINGEGYQTSLHCLQKVESKEWEITAFITERAICNVNKGEVTLPFGIYSIEECLAGHTKLSKTRFYTHGNPIPIYSVKRLSDGVEFKIGDITNYGKILRFNKNGEYALFEEVQVLLTILLKKEKLFTTEDGVDIYEGDEVWMVNPIYWERPYVTSNKQLEYLLKTHKHLKWFSTKEAAEEYILMNKPCLSLKDIDENWQFKKVDHWKVVHGSNTLKKLKELVKSRLK